MGNLESALDYLKRNLSILPLAKDKKPLMSWQEFQTRQPTELEVRQWFKQWPDANVGIVTGKISNLTVIDCDSQSAIEYFHQGYQGKTPCVKTPKGMHFYFAYQEGVRNTARLTDHIDVRSEGGYVVAPPSMNGNGTAYRFVNDLTNALDSFNYCFLYKEYVDKEKGVSTKVYNIPQESTLFEDGIKDEGLFHVAWSMQKGHAKLEYIAETLRRLMFSWGETDEKWVQAKIKSIMQRSARVDRNFSNEVEEWVLSTNGNFLSTEASKCLQMTTREEQKNLSIILKRLSERNPPLIEKVPGRNGHWRRVETDIEIINWQDADDSEYPIELPLNIHELVKLYPSNIAILAGASNTGKTSFMLETIRLNQKKYPITYLNSEMAAPELRLRLKLFEDVCKLDNWKFKAIERSSNFADVIDPDGFNVIDFMEIYDEFWKIGGWIRDIHLKLKKGIAIIAIQKKTSTKKDTQDFARGGELTLEKPRLYLAMDRGKIKIVKAKIWRNHERNPNGLTRDFHIISGWKFKPKGEWQSDEDKKYGGLIIHED
jgi:hypothetical protein